MKSTNSKPLEFTKRPNRPAREQRQTDFLRYLAQGESITDTCVLIGISRSCYEKWRKHPEFRDAVESARESHRRGALCGFHAADSTPTTIDSAAQSLHENPDKPYKTPRTKSADNHMQNQQGMSIQAGPGSTATFFKNPNRIHPGQTSASQPKPRNRGRPSGAPSALASHELGAVRLPFMSLRSHRNHR